jgi:hypothetical protein
MLKFNNLTNAQKRFVIAALVYLGEKDKTITIKKCREIFDAELNKRIPGGPKIGWPVWLIGADNKVSRGVYGFPRPSVTDLQEYQDELERKNKKTIVISADTASIETDKQIFQDVLESVENDSSLEDTWSVESK